MLSRTLVVGCRTNVLLGNDSLLYLPENVTQAATQRGQLHSENAEDYFFIAFNDFPWHLVADVVIARKAYDNYLVGLAIQEDVAVVDATATLLAVHQTDNMGGHRRNAKNDSEFNKVRIGPEFNYRTGWTTSAQYMTRFVIDEVSNRTKVIVQKRRRRHERVNRCRVSSTTASTRPVTHHPTDGIPQSRTNRSSMRSSKPPSSTLSVQSELHMPHLNKTSQVPR